MIETIMLIGQTDMPLINQIFGMATDKNDIKEKGYLTIKIDKDETINN